MWNWTGIELFFAVLSFMGFTSYHLFNKLGNWLPICRGQKMANVISRPFRDKLAQKSPVWYIWMLPSLNPQPNWPSHPTVIVFNGACLFIYLFWGNPEPGTPGWQRPHCTMWLDSVISHSSWNCAMIHFYNLNSYLVGLPGWTWWMCMIKQNKGKGQCL